ncbi:beta-galactosidase [Isoptericola sp. F-RaC21]|uniref:beta-galactosidase n=1 Tax=Isoptericola sp. F-RaC21 TaxID=3141452 RepID=UPI00315C2B4F
MTTPDVSARPTTIALDARADLLPLDGRPIRGGGTDPRGRRLEANPWFLTLDGEPLPVVSGELLPQRYPEAEWEDAVRALRDAGCTAVSSYVFWGLVEPEPGRFDFTGPNDVRRFAQICADLGMLFLPRIGPFNNSEYLVGGLPPWLFGMGVVERSNDPGYLALVRRYFEALSRELEGMYFDDGGHVLVVQLENELSHAPNDWGTLFGYTASEHRGPTGAEFTEHMAALRRIAVESGITPPFFSMTGWRTAGEVPDGEFLPTYGAYLDLHPRSGPNARLTTFLPGDYPYRGRYPIAFCELGTGSPHRAAYRSRTPADMTVTTASTAIGGTESIFLGYYLFHGGTNPVRGDGFGWTPKETTFTQRSYDFWAPVSEFGERRESFYALAPLNHLVREFGRDLAGLPVVDPADPVTDPDEDRLRAVLRGGRDRGFVFLANYGNNTPMSAREDVRLTVRRSDGDLEVPRRSRLDVRSGANLVLPVGLVLGAGVTLLSATAQPVARLGTPEAPVVVLASPGDEAEYVLAAGAEVVAPTGGAVRAEADGTSVVVRAGADEPVLVRGPGGDVRVVTLTWAEAEHAQVAGTGAAKRLVTSPDHFTLDGDGPDDCIVTVSRLRALGEADAAEAEVRVVSADGDVRVRVPLPAPGLRPEAVVTEAISPGRVVLRGTGDGPWADLWVDVDYTGDLCRVFDAGTGLLVADDFHSGTWRIKAGRFADALTGAGLQLRVEPKARKEAVDDPDGILLDSVLRTEGAAAAVEELTLLQRVTGTASMAETR